MAEFSLAFTMVPVIINLEKELARDPKALSELHMQRNQASYKLKYGLAKTLHQQLVAELTKQIFCLNIDEATSKGKTRVLEILVSFYSPTEGKVIVEHLSAIELIKVDTASVLNVILPPFTKECPVSKYGIWT